MAAILDAPRLALLDRLVRHLAAAKVVDRPVCASLDILVGGAVAGRQPAPRPDVGDSAVLAERLAVWALSRASDDAVERASAVLEDQVSDVTSDPDVRSWQRDATPCSPAGIVVNAAASS